MVTRRPALPAWYSASVLYVEPLRCPLSLHPAAPRCYTRPCPQYALEFVSVLYQYGLIGDMSSAALVGTDGSVDWCCLPAFRFSQRFCLRILDSGQIGGRFRICPVSPACIETTQRYLEDSNVLETTFTGPKPAWFPLSDFMPIPDRATTTAMSTSNQAARPSPRSTPHGNACLSGRRGHAAATFQPRHDYARVVPDLPRIGRQRGRGQLCGGYAAEGRP